MILLKILGIILAVTLLALLFVLLCPVTVNVKTDENKKIQFNVKFLFLNISNQQKKTSNENPKEKKEKKDSLFKQYLKKYGFTETVSKIFELLGEALRELSFIMSKAKFRKIYLTVVCAESDASKTALSYGAVCAAVYPVTVYIDNKCKVKKDAFDINIGCNFNEEKPDFSFEIEISLMSVMGVISAIKLFKKFKTLF